MKQQQVNLILSRYPRLCGHLICESLGYFTPTSAANVLAAHKAQEPYWCEWFLSMAGPKIKAANLKHPGQDQATKVLLTVSRGEIKNAIRRRKTHKGPMADYRYARRIIAEELGGAQPLVFASWF